MIRAPLASSLTQGTIFSCAVAEDYPAAKSCGVVITARCDVANDKADKYNYIPLIPFNDWMNLDGARLVAERVLADCKGQLLGVLKRLELSPHVLDLLPVDRIYEDLVVGASKGNAEFKRVPEQFLSTSKRLEHIQCSLLNGDFVDICRDNPKVVLSVTKDLTQHKLAEFHFVTSVSPSSSYEPHVLLLREVRHLPRVLAHGIVNGIDREMFSVMAQSDARISGCLSLDDDIALPMARIASPEVEHLMQRWTNLFGRIGVADCPPDVAERLSDDAVSKFAEGAGS